MNKQLGVFQIIFSASLASIKTNAFILKLHHSYIIIDYSVRIRRFYTIARGIALPAHRFVVED
jgi:hypothetical protein